MIIKRVIVIIKNVITLIHYGLKYLSMRALEVFSNVSFKRFSDYLKTTLDYIDKPRYISADYEEQDIMELYTYSDEDSMVSRNKYGYPIQSK